ncbi:O-antigen ligase family protein [Bradyrhizobium sp. Bra78]|uniref:O-antigen ligase family protein n=1 Tax=Bradyrhizobium sp. Bra78 TaxID=2926010 RepID=UPI0021CAC004|nr:O-antigen ligase family protein [Bradyrhizobium sp. Bra78]
MHRISRFIAVAVFVIVPLPFGSVDLIWTWIWTSLLLASLLTANLSRVCNSDFWVIGPTGAVLLLLCALAVFQIFPGVSDALADPSWRVARDIAGVTEPNRISATASVPWIGFGSCLLFVLAFLRAYLLATDEEAARQTLKTIAYAGFAYALYGILAHLAAPSALLWRSKEYYLPYATGTFVNRNTAAVFWGSCSILFLGRLARIASDALVAKQPRRHGSRSFTDHPATLAGGFLTCLVATGMTGSRAGVLLTLFSLACLANLHLMQLRFQSRHYWLGAGAVAAATLVGFLVIGGSVVGRVSLFGLTDGQRAEVYRTALEMLRGHELLGIGIGNFETAFPPHRPASLGSQGIWDKAHSTPLEMMISVGLPLGATICAIAAFFWGRMLWGTFSRLRDRDIPATAASVFLLGVLHSCIDFSLQIAGFAVIFAAISGCGLAQSISTTRRPQKI